jgi:hypothetical protein
MPIAQPHAVARGHAKPNSTMASPGANGANGMSESGNVISAAAHHAERHEVHKKRHGHERQARPQHMAPSSFSDPWPRADPETKNAFRGTRMSSILLWQPWALQSQRHLPGDKQA